MLFRSEDNRVQALCHPLADFELQLINRRRGGGVEVKAEPPLINIQPSKWIYLDSLPLDLHRLLPEIHADGGLGLVGEAPAGEAEREARLPHVGVTDDDDFKDPGLDAHLQGGGAQVHRGRDARRGFGAAAGPAPAGAVEIHGGRQDGDIVVRPVSPPDSSHAARSSGLLLRRVVGHYSGGDDAQVGVRVWRRVGEDGWVDR